MVLRNVCVYLALIVAILAVYGQVGTHDFVEFDDPKYVSENPHVCGGWSLQGVTWAFTSTEAANWHPLTWLSHMLDCQLYGPKAGAHHLTSVALHVANTLLLLGLLTSLTGALWPSAFVASLFALHPLHVESVAWVAERKDVLSAFFWMLTLWTYVRYVRDPRPSRYLAIPFAFALGLMAKPMLVTLPFVLLLIDFWPLGRMMAWRSTRAIGSGRTRLPHASGQWAVILGLVREKIPLFALAAVASVLTFVVQRQGGAVARIELLPVNIRVANAVISYVRYIAKMMWPTGLAVIYPYSALPMWSVAAATLFMVGVSIIVLRRARSHPYLLVGWLWYVGTLVPVIGLIQVGSQSMADRYTYIPLIGIFIMVAWGVPALLAGWRYRTTVLAVTGTLAMMALSIVTWYQVHYWRNSMALFARAVEVTTENHMAHYGLAKSLSRQGRAEEAISQYTAALRIFPRFAEAHNNLGVELATRGRIDEAAAHYAEALRIEPTYQEAHSNLGIALASLGKTNEAIAHYAEALRIDPNFAEAHSNLGIALASQGRIDEAITHYATALRIRPGFAKNHYLLGLALEKQQRTEEAIAHYREALRMGPDSPAALNNLAWILATHQNPKLRDAAEAIRLAERACQLTGNRVPALLDTLAAAYAEGDRFEEAVATAERAAHLAALAGQQELARQLRRHQDLYRSGRPYREVVQNHDPATPNQR